MLGKVSVRTAATASTQTTTIATAAIRFRQAERKKLISVLEQTHHHLWIGCRQLARTQCSIALPSKPRLEGGRVSGHAG